MTILNKVKWILGIVLVFLLVLTTNLIDRQNFRTVQDSLEAIYADRLVAQDLIMRISQQVWEKESRYAAAPVRRLRDEDVGIARDIGRFAATTLTPQEKEVFGHLQTDLRNLSQQEDALAAGRASRAEVMESIAGIKEQLTKLSVIQMKEGRRQLSVGKQAVSSANLFTQLEIGALLILALCVQVIILYSPGVEQDAIA